MRRSRWIAMLLIGCMILAGGCSKGASGQKKVHKSQTTETKKAQESTQESEETESDHYDMEDTQVLPDAADADEEAQIRTDIAMQLPFTAGDDKVCAVAYLGVGEESQQQNLVAFFQKYVPSYTQEQIQALPKVDNGGQQAYLIVPRYSACEVSVNRLEKQEDGTVQVIMDAAKPQGAFILYCNPSDEFSNAEVNVAYKAKVHVLVPKLSPVDHKVEAMQVALDLTDTQVYK